MSSQEQNLYSLIFIILFVVSTALLVFLLLRKTFNEKKRSRIDKEENHTISTRKLCALVLMIPSFFEFLMNTYYHIFLKNKDAVFWFSILDFLFLVGTFIVYKGYSTKWLIFILQIAQVYTFAPSILNHINEGLTLPVIRFICAFVYYIVSACIMIKVLYPNMFVKTRRIAKL